tara:strand:- start:116 stop:430 length:315 start_codon:yes stop_codon:yes gene_type:complete
VAVCVRPRDFEFGVEYTLDAPAPHDVWELFGAGYRVNPRHLVTDDALEMVSIWRLFQQGLLPDEGGVVDQAAAMIDAFGIMSSAEGELAKDLEEARNGKEKNKS